MWRKKFNVLSIFMFSFLLLGLVFSVPAKAAGKEVQIDDSTFPDAAFRNYVQITFDNDEDGILSDAEITYVREIYLPDQSFSSLQGIDVFENLTTLYCRNNNLPSLDVSENSKLTNLYCSDNQLTSLDIGNNLELIYLDCSGNQLKSLDVSKNSELTNLYCSDNQLTSLDISNNRELTNLSCGVNQLKSLDVSKNSELTKLYCNWNQLPSLDVSKNLVLTNLDCSYNQLKSLDVSKNSELTNLNCAGNQLTSLDISKNPALAKLNCGYNQLTSLDVSKNPALAELNCRYDQLTSLDVSKNPALTELDCRNNQLTSLDITKNTKLAELKCSKNSRTVTVDSSDRYNLADLPGNFDISRASNWVGGTINGTVLTFTDNVVTYKYNFGRNNWSETFTIIAENATFVNSGTASGNTETTVTSVPIGSKITDAKSKSVYKVNGNMTVEYVKSNSNNAKITIPSAVSINGKNYTVTSIANNALKNNKKIKKVIIPSTVKKIGKKAFFNCKKLKNIVIKTKSLKKNTVGKKAFQGISIKAKIKVPKAKKNAYTKILRARGLSAKVKIK